MFLVLVFYDFLEIFESFSSGFWCLNLAAAVFQFLCHYSARSQVLAQIFSTCSGPAPGFILGVHYYSDPYNQAECV
jgi:hypothetical protein